MRYHRSRCLLGRYLEDMQPKIEVLLEHAGPIKVAEDDMVRAARATVRLFESFLAIFGRQPRTLSKTQQNGGWQRLLSSSLRLGPNSPQWLLRVERGIFMMGRR